MTQTALARKEDPAVARADPQAAISEASGPSPGLPQEAAALDLVESALQRAERGDVKPDRLEDLLRARNALD
jgi:hypothetical protein